MSKRSVSSVTVEVGSSNGGEYQAPLASTPATSGSSTGTSSSRSHSFESMLQQVPSSSMLDQYANETRRTHVSPNERLQQN
ncbi:hypothetical protein QQS21_012591 [Conoideocrella luteorostrata]|uniref:Uncharacterized protein n=1 Tax=Conoideocrella luteorostrata TaxID=1105319 RepID=A0AAJ0CDR5_9HYPO|nr:hypothetical protein QQS21_012591 [Conoideocrella luteorostrata]